MIHSENSQRRVGALVRLWIALHLVCALMLASMAFCIPIINELEDQAAATLARTASGRQQLALSGLVGGILMAFLAAGISLLASWLLGPALRQSRPPKWAVQTAVGVWAILIAASILGCLSYGGRVHPFLSAL